MSIFGILFDHPEELARIKRLIKTAKWRNENPEKAKRYRHERYLKTKERHKDLAVAWRAKNRDRHIAAIKAYDKEQREKVLMHYSNGSMACRCCGESTNQFLSIDHINNDGAKHRLETKGHTTRWLIKNNFPLGFQILCMNCNFAKGKYGECPHETRRRHGK